LSHDDLFPRKRDRENKKKKKETPERT